MKEENEISNQPRIVKSHDIRIDGDYAEWIAELKHRYRSAQVKASVRVNAEKLLFNWELGRDLVQKKAEERWGAGVVEQVSLDLQREFPNADGFSTTNLWYIKQWYLFYSQEETKLQQPVGEFPSPFAYVPWGHHIAIISKCKSIGEALFYIDKTIEQGMSRAALVNSCKKSCAKQND